MKRNKQRLQVLLVITGFVTIFLVVSWLWRAFAPKASEKVFPDFNADEIVSINIDNEKEKIELKNENGSWKLKQKNTTYPLDQAKIDQVLQAFTSFERTEVVSRNKKNHINFGIDKNSLTLKNKTGKEFKVYLGSRVGMTKIHVRAGDEDNVYVAGGFGAEMLSQDYRDLTPRFINFTDSVNKIDISENGVEHSLVKKNGKWLLRDKEIGDQNKVRDIIDNLRTQARDIQIYQPNPNMFAQMQVKVTEQNKEVTINLYAQDDKVIVAREGDKYSYTYGVDYIEKFRSVIQ